MLNPRPKLLDKLEEMGFAVFENGDYNLNIIGVRKHLGTANKFDDTLVVIYKKWGLWQEKRYAITTDPGIYWLHFPMRVEGTAILVHNKQYRGAWRLAKHRGVYTALCQRKPVQVFRDNDKDSIHDMEPDNIHEGLYGINIHKAGRHSTAVNKWSAGCQVFAIDEDFDEFIDLCKMQEKMLIAETFTYTLLMEE